MDRQYDDFFSRLGDEGGIATWVSYIEQCPASDWECRKNARVHTSFSFFFSGEFIQANPTLANPPSMDAYNREFARQCYLVYLRREPDPDGFNTWVNYLNSAGGWNADYYKHVIFSFIYSAEYRGRFGQA